MFVKRKYTSQTVVEDIKSGGIRENRAITYLIREYEGKIRAFITSRNGSTEDAEDVFQEGVTAMIMNIKADKYKGDSSIQTYLYAICKGIWYKKFNKNVRDRENKSTLTVAEIDHDTPEFMVLEEEQKSLIENLFDKLRSKCKETLYLWGQSYSMQEIADELGFKNSQVAMNKKNKCLNELRNLMKENTSVIRLVNELS